MPTEARRDRKRLAGVAALLVAREIDDVTCGRYEFLNHCCPRGVRQRYDRQVSTKRSAQCSNFIGGIEAEKVGHIV
jgi:ribosomal protein L32